MLDTDTVATARDATFADLKDERLEGDENGRAELLGERFNIMGADYFMSDIYSVLLDDFGEEAGGILQSTGIGYGEDLSNLVEPDEDWNVVFGRVLGLMKYLGYSAPSVEEDRVVLPASPTAEEWNRAGNGDRKVCHFVAGVLTGAASAAQDGILQFEEERCLADGDDECVFVMQE